MRTIPCSFGLGKFLVRDGESAMFMREFLFTFIRCNFSSSAFHHPVLLLYIQRRRQRRCWGSQSTPGIWGFRKGVQLKKKRDLFLHRPQKKDSSQKNRIYQKKSEEKSLFRKKGFFVTKKQELQTLKIIKTGFTLESRRNSSHLNSVG